MHTVRTMRSDRVVMADSNSLEAAMADNKRFIIEMRE